MRPAGFILMLWIALLGGAHASTYLPLATLEVETYEKLPDVEFAALRERTMQIARGELTLEPGHTGQAFFLLSYHDEPAVLIDNSSTQLLIISFTARTPKHPSAQASRSAGVIY